MNEIKINNREYKFESAIYSSKINEKGDLVEDNKRIVLSDPYNIDEDNVNIDTMPGMILSECEILDERIESDKLIVEQTSPDPFILTLLRIGD